MSLLLFEFRKDRNIAVPALPALRSFSLHLMPLKGADQMKNNWAETWDPTLPSDLLYKSKRERQRSTVVDHVTILDISKARIAWSAVDFLEFFFYLALFLDSWFAEVASEGQP
ncbi:hypothetical protein ElyMa_005751300 [Elysia marginata]|uniref:Uncharacterized protein n=1 Tax=Elysia marginata TaxID=1093978 RepID=A0AAV4FLT0_9GAST|nr:hypothetical protein ElyMa_005751300 [Elysia marginata]